MSVQDLTTTTATPTTTQAPHKPRRLPLTPSTVTQPSVNAANCSVAKRTPSTSPSRRATALLTRVASNPSTPRNETPTPMLMSMSSAESSPCGGAGGTGLRPKVQRYWTVQECQGGYVSFPDFEIFQRPYDSANAHTQGAESGHYERRIPTV
ncbi:hypothetical protein LTS18_004028 [Coniosporium uncinatum]|uniref:Uncharacterized protein n=1 Tax=Coniosporium uncinatum TaxID=93489 RepID=A0ACC3D651_9PEZI|nr:hypothetical protein LTS18_004028 [Coniosporium uncinatum]